MEECKRKPILFAFSLLLALFYFGGDYTDDGANLFLRVEDGDLNDENKLYLISPAGKHKAGGSISQPLWLSVDLYP